jgi:hypothetical protein
MRKNPSVIKGIDSLGKLAYVSDSLADEGYPSAWKQP